MIKRGLWCITTVLMKILKKKNLKNNNNNNNIYSLAALHDSLARTYGNLETA